MSESRISVTVLVENTAWGRDIVGEHGLAYLIETKDRRVLFDTGQTAEVLLHNAERLGVDLARLDAIVLSHGHYDHTGGLSGVLATGAPVYAHPDAFLRRYSRHADGSTHEIGLPDAELAGTLADAGRLVAITGPTRIGEDILVTGPVPRVSGYEDTGGAFFTDGACTTVDPINDDQALCIETRDGVVVVMGCAHAGVINTVTYVATLTDGAPTHALIGGMHLQAASDARIGSTLSALERLAPSLVAVGHCTGQRAVTRIWSAFPESSVDFHVGSRYSFPST